jgi:hypothetical protein
MRCSFVSQYDVGNPAVRQFDTFSNPASGARQASTRFYRKQRMTCVESSLTNSFVSSSILINI